jgi:hypothetical protein
MRSSVPGISSEKLTHLAGIGWENFSFGRDGLFYMDGWRRGFTPSEIRAQFFQVQQIGCLKAAVQQARKEMEIAIQDAQEADRRAGWYRSQLVLESRMGLSLARIAG